MRAQAKRSSAANRDGSAPRGSVFGRRDDATRASSLSAGGSGAPSHRARLSVLALAIAAFALLALAPLSQARFVVNGFGAGSAFFTGGRYGGEFSFPKSGAVNSSGVGVARGTFYVVDDGLSRVQRFSPSGAFERAWGQDVIATSVDEQQFIFAQASGGTFTLTFNGFTTAPIAFNTFDSVVDDALDVLPSIGGDANVAVSKNGDSPRYIVTFQGALAAADQPQLTANTSQLTGEGTVAISTLANGSNATGGAGTGFEICTVADHCKAGSISGTTANGGQLNSPQGIAVNQANGHVYVTENGNRRVSEFDADGNFIRTWGWDVIISGRPGDVSANDFEICTVAADCKQAAAAGVNGGQFGGTIGYPVTDASNNVWVADAANRRIQEFDSSGNFIAAYGFNVNNGGALEKCTSTTAGVCRAGTSGSGAGQFSGANPTQIAFDSSGNVYAIDAGNRRVQKFDSALATAANFGASTFFVRADAPDTALFPPNGNFTDNTVPEQITSTQGGSRIAFAVSKVTGWSDTDGRPQTRLVPVTERQIIELDASDASVRDTSLVGSRLTSTSVTGLATDSVTGNLYVTTTFFSIRPKIFVLSNTPLPAPALVLNPITTKTDTTATFSGTVNPMGGIGVTCKFQYSTDQRTWTDVNEPGCDLLAPGGGAQVVSQGATGLTPNTTYYVRLSAARVLDPSSTVTTPGARIFATDSVPPVVSNVGAIHVADTSARMVGTIDPRNSATGYVFQYGTTPALGSSTAPLAIGGGTRPITVSQVVGGLSPNTTYYFKLLATNEFGSTPSVSRAFTTRTDPLPLPEDRGYEQVTPPDKNLGGADKPGGGDPFAAASLDGQSVGFCTSALFGEPAGQQFSSLCAPYISRRAPGGWQTTTPFPRYCPFDAVSGFTGSLNAFLSPNFDGAVVLKPESASCPIPSLDPAAPLPAINLYREDFTADPFDYDLLAPHDTGTDSTVIGGSDDLSHIVYMTRINQTDPPDSPAPGNFYKLYDWHNGSLSLVSKDTSNEPIRATNSSGAVFGGIPNASSVSSDGERIYFSNPVGIGQFAVVSSCGAANCELYMRESATATHHVSASECTVAPCGANRADQFQWATPSGDKAFFASCAKLTNASAPDGSCATGTNIAFEGFKLYRWDRNAPPGSRLVDLTIDKEPTDGVQPNLNGWLGGSVDGDTAYFVANGTIVSGAPGLSGVGVFRWRWNAGSPSVDYLGSLSPGFFPNPDEHNWQIPYQRRVTPDGRYLLISTRVALVPVADTDSDRDVYRWDERNGWICVSCQLPGTPSAGDASDNSDGDVNLGVSLRHTFSALKNFEPFITMSDDGRVFFSTPDALVPEDTNGEAGCDPAGFPAYVLDCWDVYEWHDGTVSLISSGVGEHSSLLIGSSASGEDVFFFTRNRLVGWDIDSGVDIYDARVGGGFPEPPAQPPVCEGDACRGPGTSAPDTTGAGSAAFQGPGNPRPPAQTRCPRGKRRVVRNGRTRCVKRRRRAANHNRRAAR